MKTILCFGDSNTFGFNPEQTCTAEMRHPKRVRWTGILSELLGEEYDVIEEGLGGRTTVFDDPPTRGRNGLAGLIPILQSHEPLDLVIIMLGTNDAKRVYNASVMEIGRGMEEIVKVCLNPYSYELGSRPKVLLISPIHLGEGIRDSWLADVFDETSPERVAALALVFEGIAKRYGCAFLDGAQIAEPSPADSVHMDPEAHRKFAEAIAARVRELL